MAAPRGGGSFPFPLGRVPRSDRVLTIVSISHWIPVWLSVHARFRRRKHVTPARRSGSRPGSKAKGSRFRRGSHAAVLTCGARGGRFASLGLVGVLNGSKGLLLGLQ